MEVSSSATAHRHFALAACPRAGKFGAKRNFRAGILAAASRTEGNQNIEIPKVTPQFDDKLDPFYRVMRDSLQLLTDVDIFFTLLSSQ